MTGDPWSRLSAELDAWGAAGLRAQVWWRDDDATAPGPALRRLLDLAAACRAPLALAVIPARMDPALPPLLADHAATPAVLQHGFTHENHAGPEAKKCELVSPDRRAAVVAELRQGREKLAATFGARFLPVLVPPWNRMSEALPARLPDLGFLGLSAYKPRRAAQAALGVVQVNCHVDILQWRPERRFLGTQAALALLTDHLAAKRRGTADPGEPSGILSHHAVHDAAAWSFLAELLQRLGRHPAARLLAPQEVFAAEVVR